MQKFLRRLERFSQSLLSPLSYLSAAGLLLVLGALLTSKPLCQALPVLQWAPLQLVGQLLYNGMMVLINNLSVILCVGVAAVRAKTEKQDAALLALMAYLVFLTANHTALEALGLLAQPNGMTGLAGTGQTTILGIQVVDTGVASGIVLGFAAAWLFNRTCEKQFYGMITQLYSGLRWSFLWLSALAVALGLGFCFVCPPLQRAVSALTGWIAASGNAGVFLYGFLERLLIPTGLHHLIYMPFQFSSLGGSLTVGSVTYTGAYAVCMTEYTMGLPLSDGIVWMYTGFTKTFGYLGIAAAFIFTARKENRARTAAAMIPLAVTASVASITEPIDSPRTPTRRRCAGSSPRWAGRRTSPSWETASPASGSRCGMPRCWIWGLCSPCPIKVLWCRVPGSSWSAACTPPSSAMRLNSSLPRWPRCDCILIRETV